MSPSFPSQECNAKKLEQAVLHQYRKLLGMSKQSAQFRFVLMCKNLGIFVVIRGSEKG